MSRSDIAVLAFKAWAVGLAVVVVISLPIMTLSRAMMAPEDALTLAGAVLAYPGAVLSSLIATSIIGPTLTAPLFAIGLGVGVVFHRAIARRPLVFVALAVAAVMALAGLEFLVLRSDDWAEATPPLQRFLVGTVSSDAWLFASGIGPAAWYFCTRLSRAAV